MKEFNTHSIIGYIANISMLGHEMIENAKRKNLIKYLIENKNEIKRTLIYSEYHRTESVIKKFF